MLALLFDIITVTALKATVPTVNVVNTMVNCNFDKWTTMTGSGCSVSVLFVAYMEGQS